MREAAVKRREMVDPRLEPKLDFLKNKSQKSKSSCVAQKIPDEIISIMIYTATL